MKDSVTPRTSPHARDRDDPRSISKALRAEILLNPCYYCGCIKADRVEHMNPVAQGGGVEDGNLVAACARCNSEKGAKTPAQWRAWRLRHNYPWPPPNTDDNLLEVLGALSDDNRALLRVALLGDDVVIEAAMGSVRDLAWTGRDGSLEDDVATITTALVGVELRAAAAQRRLARQIVKDFHEGMAQFHAVIEDAAAGPMDQPVGELTRVSRMIYVQLAYHVADFAERLTREDRWALDLLVSQTDDKDARFRRVLAMGARAAEFASVSSSNLRRLMAERLATDVAAYAEDLSDTDVTRLRALLPFRGPREQAQPA